MARSYRPVDREQEFLLPPSMMDWLPEDHLVWFVIAAVQRLETSAFHTRAKRGGVGRRGYDPDMLLTLFVYALAHGQSSSRAIERLCYTDVAFRIICAGDVPDHTVLARFRQHHHAALTDLLTESLVLAAQLGMLSLGVVAFDGTKIAANASKEANRGEKHLRRLAETFLATVAATDQAEDTLFGQDRRGDEPPPGMDRTHRRKRIEAALEEIRLRREAATEAARQHTETARAYDRDIAQGRVRVGNPPRGADLLAVAAARLERELAKAQARYQRFQQSAPGGRGGRVVPPEQHCRVRAARTAYQTAQAKQAATATASASASASSTATTSAAASTAGGGPAADPVRANLTDPHSRLLATRNGWIQGYNCQTAVSEDEFLVSARATQDANDVGQFVPVAADVVATAEVVAARTGRADLIVGVMIGDAGYDSDANLQASGPDRLIADAKGRTVTTRAVTDPAIGDLPEGATARERMNHRLRTEEGLALYKRRSPIAETPNAWLKDRRGLRQFTRRGVEAVQSELSFAAGVTNLLKLKAKGITTAQLRTA